MLPRAVMASLVLLSACAQPSVPVVPAPPVRPMTAGARCAITGDLQPSRDLFAGPDGAAEVAEFTGGTVRVNLSWIAPGGSRRAKATIWAPREGPALRLEGWLDLDGVLLHARRDLPVIPGHVWIARSAPVHVVAGEGDVLRVATSYTEGFDDLAVDVDCASVGLERPSDEPRRGVDRPHHPIARTLSLFDAPSGRVVRTLAARRFEVVTLAVKEEREGFLHVVHDDWIRIDGWVPARELAPGEAADCDDCRGGILDVDDICFGHRIPEADRDADGCVDHGEIPAVAADEAPVRAGPRPEAPVVGVLERGAAVYVLAQKDGWASIGVKGGSVLPAQAASFWVREEALRPQARSGR